jgi:hypothetical protein
MQLKKTKKKTKVKLNYFSKQVTLMITIQKTKKNPEQNS